MATGGVERPTLTKNHFDDSCFQLNLANASFFKSKMPVLQIKITICLIPEWRLGLRRCPEQNLAGVKNKKK